MLAAVVLVVHLLVRLLAARVARAVAAMVEAKQIHQPLKMEQPIPEAVVAVVDLIPRGMALVRAARASSFSRSTSHENLSTYGH
jgi:hypothetical protein